MNAISFSIYGASPLYLKGLMRNLDLAPEIYPGWEVVVWAASDVPRKFINTLRTRCDLRMPPDVSMFTRFLVNDLKVDRYLVRDADSRLNVREKRAVDEWIESGKSFHVVRDHPHHNMPIVGCMWGAVRGAIPSMANLMKGVDTATRVYNQDQLFLWNKVWPLVKHDALQHDFCCRWPGARAFPAKIGDYRFCGERFLENDEPFRYDWEKRISFMSP